MGKIYYVKHTKSYREHDWNNIVINRHKLEELKIPFKDIDLINENIILKFSEKIENENLEKIKEVITLSKDFKDKIIDLDLNNKIIKLSL